MMRSYKLYCVYASDIFVVMANKTDGDLDSEIATMDKKLDDNFGSETDHEEVQSGEADRVKKPTVDYLEWQLGQRDNHFKTSISAWRRQCGKINRLMSDSRDVSLLRAERDILHGAMECVSREYELLCDVLTALNKPGDSCKRYECVETDNYAIERDIGECIRDIECEMNEGGSKLSRRSGKSKRSGRSNMSSDSRRADAAADAAVMKTKMVYFDVESRARIELERIQVAKELNMAEAKLRAYVEEGHNDLFDPEQLPSRKSDYVEEYCRSQSQNIYPAETGINANIPHAVTNIESVIDDALDAGQNVKANVFVPAQNPPVNINTDASREQQQECFVNFAKSVADQISLGRIPPPEPGVFTGDPIAYPGWKCAFETLIEQRGIPAPEQIYYLKKYLGGAARESVEGYFLMATPDAYQEAKQLLEQRYGDPFLVASAFRDKLESWPKVMSRDGIALRKLADFLRQCQTAMRTTSSLNILNDDRENQKMLSKLPEWLVLRWNRVVADWRERLRTFPPFCEFVKFITREADIACHPITSTQALKASERSRSEVPAPRPEQRRASGANTFSTGTREHQRGSDQSKPEIESCYLCNYRHHLDECQTFLAKALVDRKDYVMCEGLCFGCLKKGHMSRQCRNRRTCTICNKQHPTSLHGDVYKPRKASEQDSKEAELSHEQPASTHSGTSLMNNTGNCSKCSMIVPVWISHKNRPATERLVYALLDTQSDTTFVLDETCDALGLEGQSVKLSLSTMCAKDQLIDSRRVDGLLVRGYDSDLKMSLPTTYTREFIPANRSHIPTSDIAQQWPHLEKIVDQLAPLLDVEVGLLIGYNCSRALAPRDVILPVCNEPYGQRTDLGWGIVDITDPNKTDCEYESIGTSHRILTEMHDGSGILLSTNTVTKEAIDSTTVLSMMKHNFCERRPCDGMFLHEDQLLNSDEIRLHGDKHCVTPLPVSENNSKLPASVNPAKMASRGMEAEELPKPSMRLDGPEFLWNKDVLPDHKASDQPSTPSRKTALKGTSSLFRWDPYLDGDGLLRVNGRLERPSLPQHTCRKHDLKVDDIILVKDENLPRNRWQLTRVHDTFIEDDDHVSTVKLAIGSLKLDSKGKRTHPIAFLERPIQKLVLLLEN
jgi:hypothetical protein